MLTGLRVAIVGAGVAGLASAVALASRGANVRLLERAGGLGEAGAGIQISPNGMAVLAALGLRQRIVDAGLRSEAVVLRRDDGRRLLTMDLRRHGRGGDWIVIHRARLIEALADAAREAGASLTLSSEVVSATDGKAPRLVLSNGEDFRADVLIGADGLRSRIRDAIGEGAEATFTGQTAWRAVVRDGEEHAAVQVFMGAGRHLVTYPLRGGLRNIVAVRERSSWTSDDWSAEGCADELRRAFGAFAPEVRDLLVRVERTNLWGLFRRPVAARFHGTRIALVGDAAHPTLPFLAQGANLALEDAWALADCLSRAHLEDALPAYSRRRRKRSARVVAAAARNAWNYHLRPGPVRWGAHTALRLVDAVAPGAVPASFEWLYGYDETA